jgi:Rrf2 family nitric oxide-sensitive transcriptional repressor
MRLTSFTDYSLRVLIYLAIRGEQNTTIAQIAQDYDISRNHLMKVVQELSQKGYVTALRGKNGGLRLSRPAGQINIGALVRDMENDLAITECFGPRNQCLLSPACNLAGVFAEALEAFLAVLDGYSLEDVLPRGRGAAELVKILGAD